MGFQRAFDRAFFVSGGNVKTSGGSKNLAKGQLAVVDIFSSGDEGATILSSFLGLPKDKKRLEVRVGTSPMKANRSYSDKAASTAPFSLSEIKKLRVSVPTRTEQTVDKVILGYDGFDPNTAFSFKTGQKYLRISLKLKNGLIQYRGGLDHEEVHVNVEIPDCDVLDDCVDCDGCAAVDCQSITLEAIKRLREHQVAGGSVVADYVDITPVFSCDSEAPEGTVDFTYYTLDVCDTGDDEALSLVQAQYNVPVIRINRAGSTSTYQLLLEDPATPADYEQSIASVLKGCTACPAGWDTVAGGYVYAITIEDDGADVSTVITTNLANAKYVAGTVVRASGNNAGVGFYTAVYSSPITAAEIASFVGTATNSRNTATIDFVGEKQAFCADDTVTEIAWVAGETCSAVTETYSIVLPDTECGESRLAELQAAYENLVIAIADSPTLSTLELTLTGTDGTANVNIDGVDYLVTSGTSLTATAAAFVTSHSAAILAATGATVTAAAGVLTFSGLNTVLEDITITNATEDLDGTLGELEAQEDRRGCQTRYTATVNTNMVCEECDPVFKDFYVSSAPESFETILWSKDEGSSILPAGNCLCGIMFTGKTFLLSGDEALRDMVGFTETSTQVQVAGGYPDEIREGIGLIEKGTYAVKYLSRWTERTHLYGNLRDMEKEGKVYFEGKRYDNGYLGRVLRGETATVQDNLKQAVFFYLEVGHEAYTQSFAGKNTQNIEYAFVVELGRHYDVMNLLNNLAANAGVPTVQA
jgi:hypothetical protein